MSKGIKFFSKLSSAIANATFLIKNADDDHLFKLGLKDSLSESGADIQNAQLYINDLADTTGITEGQDESTRKTYSSQEIIGEDKDQKEALGALDAQVNQNVIDINSNTTDIADHEARITQNEADIAQNQADIASLQANDHLNNLDAVVDPTADDDVDLGYSVGSFWYNQATDTLFICEDASDGVAVWQEISGSGGGAGEIQTNYNIVNNQVAPTDLGLEINSGIVKTFVAKYDISRESDNPSNLNTTGELIFSYDNVSGAWLPVKQTSLYDDTGVTLSITPAGVVQYTSTDIGSGSYIGALRLYDIQEIKQTAEIEQAVLNNATDENIAGQIFDKNTISTVWINFDIERSDDTPKNVNETGKIILKVDIKNNSWLPVKQPSYFDNAEVTFNITSTGQLRYSSSNYLGGSYTGKLRLTNIDIIKRVA